MRHCVNELNRQAFGGGLDQPLDYWAPAVCQSFLTNTSQAQFGVTLSGEFSAAVNDVRRHCHCHLHLQSYLISFFFFVVRPLDQGHRHQRKLPGLRSVQRLAELERVDEAGYHELCHGRDGRHAHRWWLVLLDVEDR